MRRVVVEQRAGVSEVRRVAEVPQPGIPCERGNSQPRDDKPEGVPAGVRGRVVEVPLRETHVVGRAEAVTRLRRPVATAVGRGQGARVPLGHSEVHVHPADSATERIGGGDTTAGVDSAGRGARSAECLRRSDRRDRHNRHKHECGSESRDEKLTHGNSPSSGEPPNRSASVYNDTTIEILRIVRQKERSELIGP